MPTKRIDGVSRKRFCLFMLKARRTAKASKKDVESNVVSAKAVKDKKAAIHANRKAAIQESRNRMLRVHSLRALSHFMRPASFPMIYEDDLLDVCAEEEKLPCGLGAVEAMSMMHRELTPEDYEKLCKLDETVPKNTLQPGQVDSLQRLAACEGVECGVCLSEMSAGDEAVQLPCSHGFHVACISKWLTQCKNTCPLCSKPIGNPQ
mmetsp:Transcript_73497/g.129723  ORF Transcript_73497/g.129723 Transcript_73497/m.129723 type:complete len:206 (-) Transcript_73497:50-667(-)|eukprot:CAMPEP_0197657542 /NCGR_PEP_ID=MMETSP1338-20131121/44691_1 /TAXON_ID=43686 ORGANISM="Pelagodinium beii, Strain RCC1491" /NCGR_SAMPLE_ID=MMETSP1338 /ASSEMBLY_ACC=CAM_ASM_000754 /LENGTH=205 /DNA_ID=CAMNT_0043233933 /DNA_START=77 /DNA_END=694 /DNA_ORIENTATION=+